MKILTIFLLSISSAFAAINSGEKAPNFTLTNSKGEEVSLEDYKGKVVVLEWTNYDCPFVKKFYEPGKMQKLQIQAKKDGVVWISVNSSAKGKQGHFSGDALINRISKENASPKHYLIDSDGKVGKTFGAKTTPHMYVINQKGVLAYQGAIDSIKSTKSSDIAKATNYVTEAINAVKSGGMPPKTKTKSYGCSVKY